MSDMPHTIHTVSWLKASKSGKTEPGLNLTPLKNEGMFSYQIWYLHGRSELLLLVFLKILPRKEFLPQEGKLYPMQLQVKRNDLPKCQSIYNFYSVDKITYK